MTSFRMVRARAVAISACRQTVLVAAAIAMAAPVAAQAVAERLVDAARWARAAAGDLAVPASAEWAAATAVLRERIDKLCAEPSPAALLTAQDAWVSANISLRRLEALPIGPTMDRRTLRRFDFWPTRPREIELAIAHIAANPTGWDRVGAPAQGMPALEYLLFPVRGVPAPTTAAPRCRYASGAAGIVAAEARALANAWDAWLAAAPKLEPEASRQFLDDGYNALLGVLAQMHRKSLLDPAAHRGPEPIWDAWRSGRTRTMLLATFDGVRILVSGGASGFGIVGALRERDALHNANSLSQNLDAVEGRLKRIPEAPAADSGMATIQHAAQRLNQFKNRIGNEHAKVLGIAVGFNDSDGD